MTGITEQIDCLKRRIEAAKRVAGREADTVRVLAVSKKQPVEAIAGALDAGLRDLGENYLQEALEKIRLLGDRPRWHFIGRIQANKTRLIAGNFDWVHTVSDVRIARRLSNQRPAGCGELQVCIQLKPHGSAERGGIAENGLPELAAEIRILPRLRLRGLMIMPLPGLREDEIRQEYARTRKLLEKLREEGHDPDTLSMGMSGDLEAAIMEGSTMVRIGTAIFGPRL